MTPHHRTSKSRPPRSRPPWIAAAAVLLVVLGVATFFARRGTQAPSAPGAAATGTRTGAPDLLADIRERARASLIAEGIPAADSDAAIAAFDRTLDEAAAGDPASGAPRRLDGAALSRAVDALAEPFSDRPKALATLRHAVALSYSAFGLHAPAIPLEEEALATCRRLLGDDNPETVASLANLGALLNAAGRPDDALPVLRDAVERCRRVFGPDDPQTLGALNNAAAVLWKKGKLDEARDDLQEALAGCRRVLGDDHPYTLSAENNLGVLLTEAGRYDEAEPLCREALEGRRRVLGDDHPQTIQSMDALVHVLRPLGRLDEAIALGKEALDRSIRVRGEENPETLIATTTLGTMLLDGGRPEEALAVLAPAEEAARHAFAERDPRRLGILLAALGRARTRTGDLDGAGSALEEAYLILGDPATSTTSDVTYALTCLVELEEARQAADPDGGHDRKAAEWRAELESLGGGGSSPDSR